jgi:hypothetical protein
VNIILAMLKHAWLVLRLRHDGAGMPEKIPAAMMLAATYVLLSLANARLHGSLNSHAIMGLCFVAQIYVFSLRQKLIGLIIMIGIVANAFTLVMDLLSVTSQEKVLMVTLMELVMILGAVINVIKKESPMA